MAEKQAIPDALRHIIVPEPRDPIRAAREDTESVFRKHRKAIRRAMRQALQGEQHDDR